VKEKGHEFLPGELRPTKNTDGRVGEELGEELDEESGGQHRRKIAER